MISSASEDGYWRIDEGKIIRKDPISQKPMPLVQGTENKFQSISAANKTIAYALDGQGFVHKYDVTKDQFKRIESEWNDGTVDYIAVNNPTKEHTGLWLITTEKNDKKKIWVVNNNEELSQVIVDGIQNDQNDRKYSRSNGSHANELSQPIAISTGESDIQWIIDDTGKIFSIKYEGNAGFQIINSVRNDIGIKKIETTIDGQAWGLSENGKLFMWDKEQSFVEVPLNSRYWTNKNRAITKNISWIDFTLTRSGNVIGIRKDNHGAEKLTAFKGAQLQMQDNDSNKINTLQLHPGKYSDIYITFNHNDNLYIASTSSNKPIEWKEAAVIPNSSPTEEIKIEELFDRNDSTNQSESGRKPYIHVLWSEPSNQEQRLMHESYGYTNPVGGSLFSEPTSFEMYNSEASEQIIRQQQKIPGISNSGVNEDMHMLNDLANIRKSSISLATDGAIAKDLNRAKDIEKYFKGKGNTSMTFHIGEIFGKNTKNKTDFYSTETEHLISVTIPKFKIKKDSNKHFEKLDFEFPFSIKYMGKIKESNYDYDYDNSKAMPLFSTYLTDKSETAWFVELEIFNDKGSVGGGMEYKRKFPIGSFPIYFVAGIKTSLKADWEKKARSEKNQWPLNLEAINKEQGNTKEANKDLYRRRRRAEINILPKTINDIFEFKIKLFDEQGNELNEEDLENDHYDASNILIGFDTSTIESSN